MQKHNYYICKTMTEMVYLVKNDCILKKVVDDVKNPKYKIFLFEDSEHLRRVLESR